MRAVGVIPARYQASRFPGKPLAVIAGMSMIERVWRGARGAKSLSRIIVATDDARIADACRGFGAEVALTRADHPSGTDRIAEVAAGLDCDAVVNVQGDEPLIEGFAIDALVAALAEDEEVPIATLVHAAEPEALADPNRVKVVLDRRGRALYFSRSAIPYPRVGEPRCWQHVGLYAYRRDFLLRYPQLSPTPAERAEGLEQLRALEHGYPIRCAVIEGWTSAAVDVPADVASVEARIRARSPTKSGDAQRAKGERRRAPAKGDG
jgi:3-deoxy-manno-octulosonate cytidylyltransferase (CMP-KDO synthetase)